METYQLPSLALGATEEVAPEETARATASIMPDENVPPSSSAAAPPKTSSMMAHTTENLRVLPFGVEYVIPPADEEEREKETHSAATTETVDEEIKVKAHASLDQVSSRKPQSIPMTEETDASPGSSEETEEDVDIDGSTTPLIHGEFWEVAHPNSPITTPHPSPHLSLSCLSHLQGLKKLPMVLKMQTFYLDYC